MGEAIPARGTVLRTLPANHKRLVTFVIILILFLVNQEAAVKAARISLVLLDFAGDSHTGAVSQPWNIRLKEGRANVRIASDNGSDDFFRYFLYSCLTATF